MSAVTPPGHAQALISEARAAFQRGDNEATKRLASEAVEAARSAGDERAVANALTWMARTALRRRDTATQRNFAREALAAATRTADVAATIGPLHLLVAADRMDGNFEAARRGYEHTRELSRQVGNDRMVITETLNIAAVSLLMGDAAAAMAQGRDALRATGDIRHAAVCISILGGAAVALGDLDRGARLLGAAEGVIARTGTVFDPDDDGEHAARVARAIAVLGDVGYRALAEEGRTASDQEATALALR